MSDQIENIDDMNGTEPEKQTAAATKPKRGRKAKTAPQADDTQTA